MTLLGETETNKWKAEVGKNGDPGQHETRETQKEKAREHSKKAVSFVV